MPTYEYSCDDCGHQHEEFRSLRAAGPKKCPRCPAKLGKGFNQVFGVPNAVVRGNPKTFGQAAEENARRVGREQLELMAEEDKARVSTFKGKLPKGASLNKTQAKTPPWRDGSLGIPAMDKPLDVAKVKNVKRYIETGVQS